MDTSPAPKLHIDTGDRGNHSQVIKHIRINLWSKFDWDTPKRDALSPVDPETFAYGPLHGATTSGTTDNGS